MPKIPNQPGTAQDPTPFDMDLHVQMDMSDEALITFGPPVDGGLSFHDVGYMPVNAVTIAGNTRNLPGGGMDRMFISYAAKGVQHLDSNMRPTTADYTELQYELWSYKGQATFGHAADGTPTVSGPGSHAAPLHMTLIAKGDLLQGHLMSGGDGGISGEVNVSVLLGNGQSVGELDIKVQHGARDINPLAPAPNHPLGGFTLTGGALHATFVPSHTG